MTFTHMRDFFGSADTSDGLSHFNLQVILQHEKRISTLGMNRLQTFQQGLTDGKCRDTEREEEPGFMREARDSTNRSTHGFQSRLRHKPGAGGGSVASLRVHHSGRDQ